MSEGEYYILKCPYCDANITKVLEEPDAVVMCPKCEKELNLYSVFGYNMWLASNNKAKMVKKRPIRDIKNMRQHIEEIEFNYEADDYEYDEDAIAEDLINHSSLMQKRPEVIHEALAFNSDICTMQFRYLLRMGFTRYEALEIIKKLIDQEFLL